MESTSQLRSHHRRSLYIVVGCLALVGCGSGGRLETYPISIVVSYDDGTPMNGGTLSLSSVEHHKSATGNIGSDGKCEVGTFEPRDGAVAGRHQVAIFPARPPGDPDEMPVVTLIDAKFNDPGTSGLTVDVKSDDKNEFRLQVPRLKK